MTTDYQKMMYVRAYIHYHKGVLVQVKPPQDVEQHMLLNSLYTIALNKMNKIGKKLTPL